MADLVLKFQDASLDINAGLGGLHRVTLTVGGRSQVFQPNELNSELMPIIYPALQAWRDANAPLAPGTPSGSNSGSGS